MNDTTNLTEVEVELVDITKLKLSGCNNCDGCRKNGGDCIILDDSAKSFKKFMILMRSYSALPFITGG